MARTITTLGRVDWDESQIRILLYGPNGETSQEIQRRARAVQRRAQTRAPIRTGLLRSSISVNTRFPPEGAVAEISANTPYAGFVEFGRGTVTPKNKRFLHWVDPTWGRVFVEAVGPVKPTNFLSDALDAAAD